MSTPRLSGGALGARVLPLPEPSLGWSAPQPLGSAQGVVFLDIVLGVREKLCPAVLLGSAEPRACAPLRPPPVYHCPPLNSHVTQMSAFAV